MRIIAHLDMDAFFASLEEADNPHFRGKPIAVGAEPFLGRGRGVVSTANYKAREYGIKSALPISQAWRLSEKAKAEGKPEVIFLPVDFERYEKASAQVFGIIKKYADRVEPASIDEFYFDLSFAKDYGKAKEICLKIKEEIKEKLKITCSVGVGPNKLISKISAGMKKPDGLLLIKESEAEKFLEPLSIRELPGIGPKTGSIFNQRGIEKIKDLKKIPKEELEKMLGKYGEEIYYKARGIDDSGIVENWVAKSIGEQTTFQQDTLDCAYIGEAFAKICQSVFERFLESGFTSFKTIGITVRFSDFQTHTSAKTLKISIYSKNPRRGEKEFKLQALKLLLPYLDRRKNPRKKLIRLIGVRIEKFQL